MAPRLALHSLPTDYIAIPITAEDRAIGLILHLVRPGVRLEPVRRRRIRIDDAEVEPVERKAERPKREPVASVPKKAALDIHRTLVSEEIRQKIVRLFTASEPMTIREISRRFGLSYKTVWDVVRHLQKPRTAMKPRPGRPRGKRYLGIAFRGSIAHPR